MQQPSIDNWTRTSAPQFWNEIAHNDHVLQVYSSDEVLLHALTGFVGTGINAGDCVVLIATTQRLNEINERLRAHGIHTPTLVTDERYIALAADKMLEQFMVNGMPDAQRLEKLVDSLLHRASRRGRKARFFSKMAALLWEDGNHDAAIRLEELWTGLSASRQFSIFCAHPESGFNGNTAAPVGQLCSCHSKVIESSQLQLQQVHYRPGQQRSF